MRALLWWGLTLPLLPVVLPLAIWTRRTAVRLPEAAGTPHGCVPGEGLALRVVLVGESTVAGVGVAEHSQGLGASLAQGLASATQCEVQWQVRGENGICLAEACERLLLPKPEADCIVLCFGVNDCTALSSLKHWEAAIRRAVTQLRDTGAQLVFCGVPPMADFHALPWLLRCLLGKRAALLDRRLECVCAKLGVLYAPLHVSLQKEHLAIDGYHPSAQGYQIWGEALAGYLLERGKWPQRVERG